MVCMYHRNVHSWSTQQHVCLFEKERAISLCLVNYTLQFAFQIPLNVQTCLFQHWRTVRCYGNPEIHLTLLDNEDRKERLPLLLSRTAQHLQQQTNDSPLNLSGVAFIVHLLTFWGSSQLRESQETYLSHQNEPHLLDIQQKNCRLKPHLQCHLCQWTVFYYRLSCRFENMMHQCMIHFYRSGWGQVHRFLLKSSWCFQLC